MLSIKLNKELEKALQNIADASGFSLEETIESMLTASLARKSSWGDALGAIEPGMEFNKLPNGERMRGQQLYESVYTQMRAFINSLILGERLLIAVIDICKKAGIIQLIQEDDLKRAANIYCQKAEKASSAYVN